MMSFRQWLVLLALYVVFMLLGSVVFLSLEVGHEMAQLNETFALKQQAIEVLSELENSSRANVETLLVAVGKECSHDFLHMTPDGPPTWTLWNSFFFTFTVITTIGFGHMSPATSWGRIFCIIYASLGVPLNGILVASLADLLSSKIINSRVRRRAERYQSRLGVALDAFVILVPGLLVFLLLPAAVLMVVEVDWNFLDSFYFAFITLTTIGFGDYVGGLQDHDHVLIWIYKVVMVVWIIFGLGYIVMTITFVQKALKSKKVHNVERKMASVFKRHVSRLNVSINKDLKRIRKMVNDVAVMQRQPLCLEEKRDDTLAQKAALKAKEIEGENSSFRPVAPAVSEVQLLRHAPPTHAHNPTRKSRISRSASESDLTSVDKAEAVQQLRSISNINMFLDMMEALVLKQEASAADEVRDEVRHIIEDAEDYSSGSDESSRKSDGFTSDVVAPPDLEVGYFNLGYVGSGDETAPSERQRVDEARRYERLKNRLNSLMEKPGRCTSREAAKEPTSKPPTAEGVSRSFPARVRESSESLHAHLTTIFHRPHSVRRPRKESPDRPIEKVADEVQPDSKQVVMTGEPEEDNTHL